jgi:hypothetical protein
VTFDPVALLSMWAAGLAAAAMAVAWWKVARPGFLWLAGGVVALVGLAAAFDGAVGSAGVGLALVAAALARRPQQAGLLFGFAAVAFFVVAAERDDLLPTFTGALALGGITGEMMLGHWFLVDPRLPRWALRRLAAVGVAGVVADVAVAVTRGTVAPPTDLFGAAFLVLALTTVLLGVGVWFSLKEQGYQAVMAATGLSYLATLTVLGVAFLARTPVLA